MNPLLQRHCAKYIYIVPDGLRELMSDISREVIRSKPENMYTFIADYLDALMITRENARVAAKLVESITDIAETTVNLLADIGLTREEANQIVTIIQVHFRAFLVHKHRDEDGDITQNIIDDIAIPLEKQEEVALIIQRAYRKFLERKQREKQLLFGMVDWRIAARSTIALYKRTGATSYEANRAATLIQTAYKGYYTRRIMRKLLSKGLSDESISIEEIEETEEFEEIAESTDTTEYSNFDDVSKQLDFRRFGLKFSYKSDQVSTKEYGEELPDDNESRAFVTDFTSDDELSVESIENYNKDDFSINEEENYEETINQSEGLVTSTDITGDQSKYIASKEEISKNVHATEESTIKTDEKIVQEEAKEDKPDKEEGGIEAEGRIEAEGGIEGKEGKEADEEEVTTDHTDVTTDTELTYTTTEA